MRNRVRTIMLAGGTALVLALTAAPSFAATMTWTVTPGGALAGTAKATSLSDPHTGFTVFTCTSSSFAGTLRSGSGLPGSDIGTISRVGYSGCSAASLTVSGFPWAVNFASLSKGVVHGTLTGIHFVVRMTGSGCTATIDGTSATADNGSASRGRSAPAS